jgi:hypothetical protein
VTLHEALNQAASSAARSIRVFACSLGLASSLGCTPTVSVFGVYFPGWLISAVVGLVAAYALVAWLSRRPSALALAQSGLLFCSLALIVGLSVWSIFFAGF